MTTKTKIKKKKALRHNEYYDMQNEFDELYKKGKSNFGFYNLMQYIKNPKNILLAYRNIKRNKGSKTKGTNNSTIVDIGEKEPEKLIAYVNKRLDNYKPEPIRRVEIPKPDGRTRPLGIATIEDRLIQQTIKQVLEPILEAKFYEHSYGFRPDRGTHYAIARMNHLAFSGYHYVVDIDIKSFFDEIDHGKLLKQLWTLGIKDKNLLEIISRMLKSEIQGIGTSDRGVIQGGVISPLLANVVLNELDWWISSQWDNMLTKHEYVNTKSKTKELKKSKLKNIKIVRYCDDFKIMCKNMETAKKIFVATEKWLKDRLKLSINKEKSKITNIRKNYSNFLGFKLKVRKGKGGKYTNRSHLQDKAKEKAVKTLNSKIDDIKDKPTVKIVNIYNAVVLNLQNYFKAASMVSQDFAEIAYKVNKHLRGKTKNIRADTKTKDITKSKTYLKFYGEYNYKIITVAKTILFPIAAIKWKKCNQFSQEICRYTPLGRAKIHDNLKLDVTILTYLMRNPVQGESVEYNDNRISLYSGQYGRCAISNISLEIGNMKVHHIIPRNSGGKDMYNNLILVTGEIHILIHATIEDTIAEYLKKVKLDDLGFDKLNKFRILVGNSEIDKFIYYRWQAV
jgi:group II intron reverse transcriptase/maturase